MTVLINQLRRPESSNSFNSLRVSSGHIDGLRVAAAGALIEIATTMSIGRAHLVSGGRPSDPYFKGILATAREIIRDGGDVDAALDINPDDLPIDCFPRRLLRLSSAPGVRLPRDVQNSDRLAAATKLAIIDDGLIFMIRQSQKFRHKDMITAVETISKRCWTLPDNLPDFSELAVKGQERVFHELEELC